jgi:galactose mutarotase-like enzyme
LRVAPGFHPYFAVEPSETSVKVNDRAYELNTLAGTEFMVADTARLRTSTRDISITQENLTTWAIWTDKLGNYVCVEPTFCGNRFLGDERPDELLAPGETKQYSITISW